MINKLVADKRREKSAAQVQDKLMSRWKMT
jgi:hypothetical protein